MGYDKGKTSPGQPFRFPAGLYNDLLDVVAWFRRTRGEYRLGKFASQFPISPTQGMIRNNTGGAVKRFAILEIDGHFAGGNDFWNQYPLKGVEPTAADERKLVIVQGGGPAGAMLPCVLSGVSVVRVERNDAGHNFAIPIAADSEKLETAETGLFEILTSYDLGGGIDAALVRFPVAEGGGGGSPWIVATLDEDVDSESAEAGIEATIIESHYGADAVSATAICSNEMELFGPAGTKIIALKRDPATLSGSPSDPDPYIILNMPCTELSAGGGVEPGGGMG